MSWFILNSEWDETKPFNYSRAITESATATFSYSRTILNFATATFNYSRAIWGFGFATFNYSRSIQNYANVYFNYSRTIYDTLSGKIVYTFNMAKTITKFFSGKRYLFKFNRR